MPITPMPALTLRQSTAQISQNCGVLCASLQMNVLLRDHRVGAVRGGVQPSGRQPAGGTR